MKRSVLFLASAVLSTGMVALGQQTSPQIHEGSAKLEVSKDAMKAVDGFNRDYTPVEPSKKTENHGKYRAEVYDFVKVGNTYYDLQTNASIGRRAILHDDGTITVAWTYSGSPSTTWPDRGSAVNYYDGTNWGAAPTTRTENIRTGWPSIGMFDDGSIYTIAHDAADGGLLIARNTGKGKTDWTSDSKKVCEHQDGNMIWNRTANNGNIMHSLSNFSAQADDPDVVVGGITNPTLYSRSLDGGKTWDKLHLLPGYDSVRYLDGAGDTYAIDVRDSVVAIVIAGRFKDVTLWKSMDNGDNWTKIVADTFAFGRFEWGTKLVDVNNPIPSNDGAVDVLIDNDNVVHIVSGRVSYSDDDTTDDLARSGSFFNLYHWSETKGTWDACGTPIDMDGQNNANGAPYDITAETTNSMGSDGNPANGLAYAARYGGTSISTHPSLSVDKDNNLYVTWDCPVEFTFNDYLANYRDVHISYSTDDGVSWATTQNATQLRSTEAVFACLTKRTDDFVHFIFQADEHPGTNLQNSGSGNLHPNVENTIYYAAIPVQDLMDGKLGQNTLAVNPELKDSKVFVVSQNEPNPFSESTNVVIYMRAGSELNCTITDATGKVVSNMDLGYKNAGNHKLSIDGTNLTSGVYFYTLTTKDSQVTNKMQVVK